MAAVYARGFTLLELLVTLAVAVILLTIAIPTYRSVISRNSLASNVNDLVGALNYARSEAVSRGAPVYICASRDRTSCRSDGVWSDGWIVYAPDPDADHSPAEDNLLRTHGAVGSHFTLTANDQGNPLSFNADGFATNSNCKFTAQSGTDNDKTHVTVATTGRVSTTHETGGSP